MKRTEICNNCGDDYIPKRRGVQKFCSNSCRSRSWLLKQNKPRVPKIMNEQDEIQVHRNLPAPKDKISLASVGNAALGSLAADLAKNVFTSNDNKPASKKDVQELKSFIKGQRYLPVNNGQNDAQGRNPFYDVESGNVVFK